ncbi:hypothetical protein A9239_12470 [Methanosarcina sp. A14]|nr:hypothetical protein [Methanosarcina sp. A14]OED05162.1 hypothetical protein A9239_12470 [Methanosarcina sp. A14]
MKKKTGIYNEIFSRKWRLIFITLVLIFSVISISATGAGSQTNSQARDKVVHESNIGVSNETEDNYLYYIVDENYTEVNCFDCMENDEDNNTKDDYSSCTKSDKNYTDKCSYCIEDEENLEQKVGENKSKENQETGENNTKLETGTGKSTETKEKVENSTKSETEKNTTTQKTVENNTKSETGTEAGKNTTTQKTVENNTK